MPLIDQQVDELTPDLDRRLRQFLSEILVTQEGEWTARSGTAQSGAFVRIEVKASGFVRTIWICREELAFHPDQVRTFLRRALQADAEAHPELQKGIA